MPDYSKGKIYRLSHGDKYYIGSTTQSLANRKGRHHVYIERETSTSSLANYMRAVDWKEVIITLLEDVRCDSKEQLTAREHAHLQPCLTDANCLNMNHAISTTKGRDTWGETRKKTVVCECGMEIKIMSLYLHKKSHIHNSLLGSGPQELETCQCGKQLTKNSMYLHKKSHCAMNQ